MKYKRVNGAVTDLSRTVLGCSIAAAGMLVFALITLICGLLPSAQRASKKGCIYLSTAVLLMLAGK